MTRFGAGLLALATLSGCGPDGKAPRVAANARADSAHFAAQATEPRTGDPTAAQPPNLLPSTVIAAPARVGATAATTAATATAATPTTEPSAAAAPPPSAAPHAATASVGEPRQISARHVLIQWMGSDRAPRSVLRTREQALAVAQEVLQRAKTGEDIARLAVEYSDEPSAGQRGGSLGRFGKGQMVGAFEQVAFKLAVGEISGIVETPFGFHIIQRTE